MDYKKMALGTLLGATATFYALSAVAQTDRTSGENEYMQACASCHGASGTGDGPLADLLTVSIPDLTTISANNDGVFPLLDVIMTIDGRTASVGHGFPMPVWGDRFSSDVGKSAGPYGAEVLVRGRVLTLAEYLESIQQ